MFIWREKKCFHISSSLTCWLPFITNRSFLTIRVQLGQNRWRLECHFYDPPWLTFTELYCIRRKEIFQAKTGMFWIYQKTININGIFIDKLHIIGMKKNGPGLEFSARFTMKSLKIEYFISRGSFIWCDLSYYQFFFHYQFFFIIGFM